MTISLTPYIAHRTNSNTSQALRTSPGGGRATANDGSPDASVSSQQASSALGRESSAHKETSRSEKLRTERLHEALGAMQRLRDMPKKTEEDKIGFLRQRIEMLKMLLVYASPKQAKAIAEELKSIGKELANVSKGLGSGSGNSIPSTGGLEAGAASVAKVEGLQGTGAQPVTAGERIAAQGAQETGLIASAAPGTQVDSAVQAEVSRDDTSAPAASNEAVHAYNGSSFKPVSEPADEGSTSAQGDDDATLRGLLEEAQKHMKEAISALKMKLAEGDKEARKALADAEKSLDKLSGALAQSAGDSLYTALGSLLPTGSGTSAGVSFSVSPEININV